MFRKFFTNKDIICYNTLYFVKTFICSQIRSVLLCACGKIFLLFDLKIKMALFTEFKKISQNVLTTCFTLIYLIP